MGHIKPKWLLENNTFKEEGYNDLLIALKSQGIEYKFTKYIPFSENEDSYSKLFEKDDCVVTYGSIQLAKMINKYCSWIPGVYADFQKFNCSYYYSHLSKYLINSPYIMMPYGDLLNQKEFIFDTLSDNSGLFIRPNSGLKLFNGAVIYKENYDQEIKGLGLSTFEVEKLVLLSKQQNIYREWRLVVVKRKVIAASQYRIYGKRNLSKDCPKEVIDFGNEVAKIWQPENAWVIDVCSLFNGDLKVVEIGSFSCAGLYLCDMNTVVKEVSEAAVEDWMDLHYE